MYSIFLEDWLRVIPHNQIFITSLTKYSQNMKRELHKLFDFLELREFYHM